jgi:hypothetical protein
MNHEDLDTLITRLEHNVNHGPGMFGDARGHHKECWSAVKEIGAAFKQTRYPSGAEKQAAWQRFQQIVNQMKQQAEEQRRQHQCQYEERTRRSAEARRRIIALGESALPSHDAFSAFETIAAMPLMMITETLDALLDRESFNRAKEELKRGSERLRRAFAELKEERGLSREDRQAVWERLQEIQRQLNEAWAQNKEAGDRAYEQRQRKKEEARRRKAQWEQDQRAYVERLRQALCKQEDYLRAKERQMEDLSDKHGSARSDSFRERVEGWIEELREKIARVEESIRELERKIREAEDRLNG